MIGYMVYAEAFVLTIHDAVALLSWRKLTRCHQDWHSFSNLVVLSQIIFQISVGKVPSSLSLIIAATVDCTHGFCVLFKVSRNSNMCSCTWSSRHKIHFTSNNS